MVRLDLRLDERELLAKPVFSCTVLDETIDHRAHQQRDEPGGPSEAGNDEQRHKRKSFRRTEEFKLVEGNQS